MKGNTWNSEIKKEGLVEELKKELKLKEDLHKERLRPHRPLVKSKYRNTYRNS